MLLLCYTQSNVHLSLSSIRSRIEFCLTGDNVVVEVIHALPASPSPPEQPQLHRQVQEVGSKEGERIRESEEHVLMPAVREESEEQGGTVGFPESGDQVCCCASYTFCCAAL